MQKTWSKSVVSVLRRGENDRKTTIEKPTSLMLSFDADAMKPTSNLCQQSGATRMNKED